MANKRHAVEDVNLFNSVAHLPDKELQEYPSDQSTIGIGANRAKFDKSVGNGKESLMISAVELNNRETPWRTTFIRSGPLSGIFCMLLAIASIVASFGILVGSNGMPIMSWSAPPSTYLAICTAIANLCMRYACIQGVVIAWWYRACRGSTLAKLHHDWRSGTTLRGALTAGRHMGLLGLACIFSTLVVIDGPLLQRASIVITVPLTNQTVPLTISMAPEIPNGFTGVWATTQDLGLSYWWSPAWNSTIPTGNGTAPNDIMSMEGQSHAATQLSKLYNSDAALDGVVRGCNSRCTAKLRAPALAATSCKTHVLPVNYHHAPYSNATSALIFAAPSLDQEAFLISIGLQVDQRESIYVVTGLADTENCIGTFTYQSCTLEPAIGEYDILVRGTTAYLQNAGHPVIVEMANNTAVNHTFDPSIFGHPSTLAEIALLASDKYESYVAMYRSPTPGNPVTGGFVGTGSTPYTHNGGSTCPSFSDPRSDVLQDLNKLMVWTGALAASRDASYTSGLEARMDAGLQMETTASGYLEGDHSVFHTDFGYFVAAVLVEIICIALVAPTYWGWWQIGRSVSFSPLEMAKAFESPLLAHCNSNASGRNIAKTVGETPIRYGVVHGSSGETAKLAFAPPNFVHTPHKGARLEA